MRATRARRAKRAKTMEEVADEEVPVREKTVEPKWDEVLVEEGSEEDVDEEVV